MKKKAFLLLILTALIFSISPSPAYACSCVQPAPPLESVEASDAVFLGKVTNSEMIPRGEEEFRGDDDVRVTFDVSKVWKGPASQTLVVVTALDGALCGLGRTFMIGEEYLVYAYALEAGNELWAGLCSRTTHISNAQEDLAELNRLGGRPPPPLPREDEPRPEEPPPVEVPPPLPPVVPPPEEIPPEDPDPTPQFDFEAILPNYYYLILGAVAVVIAVILTSRRSGR